MTGFVLLHKIDRNLSSKLLFSSQMRKGRDTAISAEKHSSITHTNSSKSKKQDSCQKC